MSEKEKLLRDINALSSHEIKMLRTWMRNIRRGGNRRRKTERKNEAYLDVRKALRGIKGSLAADVALHREDRV